MAEPAPGYMLCTAPRSGSTLLCTLLRATGVAGWPESHFHGPTLAAWARGLDLPHRDVPDVEELLAAGLTTGRAGGPVFGLRQQWPSFPLLCRTLADHRADHRAERTDRARLEAAFGPLRYIHLARPDKLAQAVSYLRAEQSGLWHRNADGSIYEEKRPTRTGGYDRAAIRSQIEEFQSHDAGWRSWFAAQGIRPLRLTYDALSADPTGTLARVLGWIGLDPRAAQGIAAPTQKLADRVSSAWIARYRAEVAQDVL